MKEALQARIEQERLKAQFAWRVLPNEISADLERHLSQHPGKINVQYVANDPEALYFAIQFANIFVNAKWEVQMLAMQIAGTAIFGIWIPDSPSPDTAIARDAFGAARIGFSSDVLPRGGIGFGGAIENAAILFVGSKVIPQQ